MQSDPAPSEESVLPPVREGLPKAFRMRHGRHYVEQLMGDAPLRTVREIAVADFHAVPESDADLSTLQQSIGSVGVLQPLLVTLEQGRYHVIAGRNRLRAAMALGLQTVPCLVHDVAGEGLDSLRQAAGLRAILPIEENGSGERALEQHFSTGSRTDANRPESAVPSPSTISVAGDDRLRLAVLADLMQVELQRGETIGTASETLNTTSRVSRQPVAVGGLVDRLISRVGPEARLRNASVEVTISDAAYRIVADARLLSIALDCMAHGMLLLCTGARATFRVAVDGTRVRPALIVEISQEVAQTEPHASRRFS